MTKPPEYEDAILLSFDGVADSPRGKRILEFKLPALCVGDRVLSQNVDLTVFGRQKVCIIGNNGCGKTTLLRMIAQHLLSRKDVQAAYMPQDYDEQLEGNLTPVEFLCVRGDKEEVTQVRTLLGSMKFTAAEVEHDVKQLSGGQRAKLFFLKMNLRGANVLILDEPTRNFSPLSNPVIRQVLCDYGGTIISVSHDRKYIEQVCDTLYQLTPNGLVKVNK